MNNNSKRKLYVIDLDKTLITVNSARKIIPLIHSVQMYLVTFFRLCKVISKRKYMQQYTLSVDNYVSKHGTEAIVNTLKNFLNTDLIHLLETKNTTDNDTVLILSASPDSYVSSFAKTLGYKGVGSFYSDKKFRYLYSAVKLEYVKANYPEKDFEYECAVSDNVSDKILLKEFKKRYIIKNQEIKQL